MQKSRCLPAYFDPYKYRSHRLFEFFVIFYFWIAEILLTCHLKRIFSKKSPVFFFNCFPIVLNTFGDSWELFEMVQNVVIYCMMNK